MTVTAQFTAPIERVWQLWADPRKLERWWGPPTYPATVVEHSLVTSGRVAYVMVGPEGDRHGGYWNVVSVDAPNALDVVDGFSDDDGQPNPNMPTIAMSVRLTSTADGTEVLISSRFGSLEQMEQLLAMGMDEGMREAMGQMDALIAD